MMPTSIC